MDNEIIFTENQQMESKLIKVEVLEIENNPFCYEEEKVQAYMKDEIKNENDEIFKHECSVCDRIFPKEISLNRHNNEQHQNNGDLGESAARTELQIEKPFKCDFDGCTKSFKQKFHLREHMNVHNSKNQFKCQQKGCSTSFKRLRALKEHMKLHREERPFKCSHQDCDKGFKKKIYLQRHQITHSNGSNEITVEEFLCEIPGCNSKFRRKDSHRRHMRNHEFGKRFRCTWDGCRAEYFQIADLRNHMTVHTGERLFCTFEGCLKSFPNKFRLATHQESHSDRVYACTYKNCKKNFNGSENLKRHLRKHQKKSKSTNVKEMAHNQVQGSENVHQCSVCKNMFGEEIDFKEHTKSCKNYNSFEFVDANGIEINDVTTDVKQECGSKE